MARYAVIVQEHPVMCPNDFVLLSELAGGHMSQAFPVTVCLLSENLQPDIYDYTKCFP